MAFCLIPFSGFETVSTCLYWNFLYLIHYPEIQARIQEEIGNIFSGENIILTTVIFIIKFLKNYLFFQMETLV